MHESLLQDLAVVLITAAVVTLLFRKLRQPAVLGYLLAGMVIGPNTPPASLIHDEATIHTLGELGVVMLMFSLGLHFSLRKLFEVGASAVTAAFMEIVLMMAVGYGIGRAFGWTQMDSVFLGAMLSVSSTTIIVKAIQELGKMKERFANITFGVLIVEDLAAVVMIALLSSVAVTGSASVEGMAATLTNLTFFTTVVLVLGFIAVPWLFNIIHRYRSDEMFVVTSLALCFGVSALAHSLGFSVALGAFAVGAIIAETRQGPKVEELSAPIRDLFSAVFFVTIGMLIDLTILEEHALAIAVITVAVIVGKVLSCTFGTMVAGNGMRTSLLVGFSLSQIGEFSFIIAAVGMASGATSDFLYPIAIAVSAITTFTTPYLIRGSDTVAERFTKMMPTAFAETTSLYSRLRPESAAPTAMEMVLRRELRRSLLQILLNLVLVGAMFAIASAVGVRLPGLEAYVPRQLGGVDGLLWAGVLLLSMPMLIAIFRKLQAISLMLAETSVPQDLPDERKYHLRRVVSRMLLTVMTTLLFAALLMMGASLLPPWPVLLVFLGIFGLVVSRLWGHFVLVYSRAQVALRQTLTENPPPQTAPKALTHLLAGAHLDQVLVPPAAAAAGKMIREIEIRRRSGASVIAIEREDAPILNPGPHEELRAGDTIFLFGSDEQCAAARGLLTESP